LFLSANNRIHHPEFNWITHPRYFSSHAGSTHETIAEASLALARHHRYEVSFRYDADEASALDDRNAAIALTAGLARPRDFSTCRAAWDFGHCHSPAARYKGFSLRRLHFTAPTNNCHLAEGFF
jgi:hypothetical protein